MCFTPLISISTAVIEFILATVLLLFFPKSKLRNFFAAFIYLLGFYQFTEFMLCSSGYSILWAAVGFATYSFLPAIALHSVLKIFRKKINLVLLYIIPVIAALSAFIIPNFITRAECKGFFIEVGTILLAGNSFVKLIPFIIYIIYYAGFMSLATVIIYHDYVKQRNEIKKEIELVEIIGVLLMTVPTLILIILFPAFGIMFPSVLCEFAIFLAIAAFVGAYLEGKIKNAKV